MSKSCTCHPDEAPVPCQERYVASECMERAMEKHTLMDEKRIREIFAEECIRNGMTMLAARILDGTDNSHGGTAALAAMRRIVKECQRDA